MRGGPSIAVGGTVVALPTAGTTPDDGDLAAFASSLELVLVAAYQRVTRLCRGAARSTTVAFQTHHQQHADAFAALAGTKATHVPNAKVAAIFAPALAKMVTQTDALALAFGLESQVASTYQYALENLTTRPALVLASGIEPVEAQHAVVLGMLLGQPLANLVPGFQSKDEFIDPAKFPLA